MQQKQIIGAAQKCIELYYRQEMKYFSETLIVAENNVLLSDRKERRDRALLYHVVHNRYRIVLQSGQMALIVGTFRLLLIADSGRKEEKICVATIVLSIEDQGVKVIMLHISEKASDRQYKLRDTRECCYLMDEIDVFYLEAGHNHTKWHCRNEVIETSGNLSCTEKQLSDSFVRIHRGFIVNKSHVRKIARCYVELDNGIQLQVPVKKYIAIKERLMSTLDEND